MTSKERLLCSLNREKPDRLPATVHQWQGYHLDKYLSGISDMEAFIRVGLDAQIQYFEDMAQFWLVDADFHLSDTYHSILHLDHDRLLQQHPEGT